jgi:hypothetical protein
MQQTSWHSLKDEIISDHSIERTPRYQYLHLRVHQLTGARRGGEYFCVMCISACVTEEVLFNLWTNNSDCGSTEMEFLDINFTEDSSLLLHA